MKVSNTIATVLVLSILAACTPYPQTGTGGYDQETVALLAVATQTAAYNRINATATTQAATLQAAYAQQTAVSYQATASKQAEILATQQAHAQETAVSATETQVYKPAALRQTEEAQTVLMQREALNTQATATAVQFEIDQREKSAVRMGYLWDGLVFIVLLTGLATALGLFGQATKQWRSAEFVEDGNGHIVAIDRRLVETKNVRHIRPTIIENQAPQIKAPYSNMQTKPVTFKNIHGEQKIEVTDRSPEIPLIKWQMFADAVLIEEISPSRRAITDHCQNISQTDHKSIYDFMVDNDLAEVGSKDEMIINGAGYEYLYNKLPQHLQREVNLPHPDGMQPVFEDINQPVNRTNR